MSQFSKFEEYKLFVEDTARFSERRQTVTNIYTAVNSILLAGVALLVRESGLQSTIIALSSIGLLVAGIFICIFWYQLIIRYKDLVGLRLRELRHMEESPNMVDSHKMYHKEDELYPRDESGELIKEKVSAFSDLERGIPIVFIILYTVFLSGIIIGWIMGLI